jgi:flavin-binding protein dodecin
VTTDTVAPERQELDEADIRAIQTVEKLLALAGKNPNANEAAAAAAKAQAILAERNLDMAAVEEAQGKTSGKREEAKLRGGMYTYQNQLWRAVAELNFCYYMCYRGHEEVKTRRRSLWSGEMITDTRYKRVWRHHVIGRIVNVRTTHALATYLESTVERLLMERLGDDNSQRFSSWAVAFREGAVHDIVTRLEAKRARVIAQEERERREAEERARTAGTSLERAISTQTVAQTEKDANMDFIHGEGWSAKQRARRAEAARAKAEAEAEYAAWAAANPEEAKEKEAERAEEERKYWARRRGGGGSTPDTASDKNPGAWRAGREAAADIGIDEQLGEKKGGLLR